MSRSTETRSIGENRYEVTMLGALTGRKVLFRLGKLLGPLMAGGTSPAALGMALRGLDEADFEWLCNTFAASTKVVQTSTNGDVRIALEGVFDVHFAGHYGHMVDWLAFCVTVNFQSFLAELPAESLLNALKTPKP